MDSNNKEYQWYTEAELPHSDTQVKISFAYTEQLYREESEFGTIEIFDTPFYGRLLALDGIVQVAEKDEFIYHEMMVALPSIYHGNPKSILIIGGGDGGAAKQALKVSSLEKITMVEIDQKVIDLCNKYMPTIGDGALEDSKVKVVIQDGKEFIETTDEKYDIIALDLTDPIPDGPAAELFSADFYKKLSATLNVGGIVVTHCGSLLFQPEETGIIKERLASAFKYIRQHVATIPTYQLSLFGFLYASNGNSLQLDENSKDKFSMFSQKCKYLSYETLFSSRELPPYLKEKLEAPK